MRLLCLRLKLSVCFIATLKKWSCQWTVRCVCSEEKSRPGVRPKLRRQPPSSHAKGLRVHCNTGQESEVFSFCLQPSQSQQYVQFLTDMSVWPEGCTMAHDIAAVRCLLDPDLSVTVVSWRYRYTTLLTPFDHRTETFDCSEPTTARMKFESGQDKMRARRNDVTVGRPCHINHKKTLGATN